MEKSLIISIIIAFLTLLITSCGSTDLERGYRFIQREKYPEAISCINRYLKQKKYTSIKHEATAYFCLGLSYAMRNETDKAICNYSYAINLVPDFYYPRFNRGLELMFKGQFEQALCDFESTEKIINQIYINKKTNALLYNEKNLDKDMIITVYYKLMLNIGLGKYQEAGKAINQILSNKLCNSNFMAFIVDIYLCKSPIYNPHKALELCDAIVATGRLSKENTIVVAQAYATNGYFDRALSFLNKSNFKSNSNVKLHINKYKNKNYHPMSINDFFKNWLNQQRKRELPAVNRRKWFR